MDETRWSELVLRIRAGDRAAENELFQHLERLLRAFFQRRIPYRPELVDDLVQNTLLRIHQGLPQLRRPDRLKAFVLKAALFELHDFYRGRYQPKETSYDPVETPVQGDTHTEAAQLDLEKAMKRLSPHARKILELKIYGYPYAEIARLLQTTEGAVKMQVKRAMEQMRKWLLLWLLGTMYVLLFLQH